MADPQAAALGAEDFAALNTMAVASKAGQQQADALIAKMTPEEKSGFYTYVNQLPHGSAATRVDGAIASGVPVLGSVTPEDALIGTGIVRAVGAKGLSAGGRVLAGAQTAAGTALPVIKYEAVKAGLVAMGVPASAATIAAMIASGYNGKKGSLAASAAGDAKAADAATATRAPIETPRELTQRVKGEYRAANPAPAAAPTEFEAAQAARQAASAAPARPPNALPDQRALNEAALQARREAYQASLQTAPAIETPPPAGPVLKASGKMKLTAPEFKEFQRLTNKGIPLADAEALVKAQRAANATGGTLSDAEVAAEIAARKRNASGRR